MRYLRFFVIPLIFSLLGAVIAFHGYAIAQDAPATNTAPDHAQADTNCITCHIDMEDEVLTPPVDDWKKSIHAQAGVSCHDCHGGDPIDEDLAMEPDAGFLGKPTKKDIPKFCAKCHGDAKKMRNYNLRADQYSLYSGSIHGRKLRAGDEDAPSCVDCHGKHKILAVKDPQSTVSRNNIPRTCGKCHAKAEIFEKRGKNHNQLELYKQSRHYELYSQGDLLAPTCVNCHGNHSILPARSERTQTVCFDCHSAQAQAYKASPHWKAFKTDGEPVCLHCHSNHAVTRPTTAKFSGDGAIDCVECHDKNSDAYVKGIEVQRITVAASQAADEATEALTDFKANAHGGFEFAKLDERLVKIKDQLKELHTATHKLNVDELKKRSEGVVKSATFITTKVNDMWDEIHKRMLGLVVAWIVFIGFTWALWAKSKMVEKGREE